MIVFLLGCTQVSSDATPDAPIAAVTDHGCALTTDLATPNFLEGDTIRFTVGCAGVLATEDALVSLAEAPAGASFDPDTLRLTWETGPADGGAIALTFAVRPRATPDAPPERHTVPLWVADDPSSRRNVRVDPAAYTEEWGLPVVHVATGDPVPDEYADATITWYGRAYPASIKVHGKTSASYPKKSYGLKLLDAELPIEEWGVTRDHLLLISTFDDNSYVRQKLVYDVWTAIADYWGDQRLAPRAFFTVVYLNGEYLGLYLGVDRLDDEWVNQMGFDGDANLYKAVRTSANFGLYDRFGAPKVTLHQGYEKKEGEPEDDFSDLEALVRFTGTSTAEALIAGADDWFHLDEYMDAFLLLYYTNGEDSYTKNAYVYHDPADDRFRYAPWDFNASYGQSWCTERRSADFEDAWAVENRIFWAILDQPDTTAELWARFDQLRDSGPFSAEWQLATLDAYYARIDPSARRDWEVWGPQYQNYAGWAELRAGEGDWTDYEGERAYLYQWVQDRAAYFAVAYPGP